MSSNWNDTEKCYKHAHSFRVDSSCALACSISKSQVSSWCFWAMRGCNLMLLSISFTIFWRGGILRQLLSRIACSPLTLVNSIHFYTYQFKFAQWSCRISFPLAYSKSITVYYRVFQVMAYYSVYTFWLHCWTAPPIQISQFKSRIITSVLLLLERCVNLNGFPYSYWISCLC